MTDASVLSAVFATILPGDDLYPSAGLLPLGERAPTYPHFAPAIAGTLNALPADFAALNQSSQTAILRDLEAARPELFSAFVTAAYSLYYSDKTVLGVIAEAENYTPRSPQPEGYALKPFDPAVVATPATHSPSWRPTEQSHA